MTENDDGTIRCNKDEIVDLGYAIKTLFKELDGIALKDIENLISEQEIKLYKITKNDTYQTNSEVLLLENVDKPFCIRAELDPYELDKQLIYIDMFEFSYERYRCTERIAEGGRSTMYYFKKNDLKEYIKSHKEFASGTENKTKEETPIGKKERDSYLKVIASLFASHRKKPWKDTLDRDAVSLIVELTQKTGLGVCESTVRKIVNEIKEL